MLNTIWEEEASSSTNLVDDDLNTTVQTSTNSVSRPEVKPGCMYIPARFVLTGMMFMGLFLVYALRVNLSITLVAMVNQTALKANRSTGNQCPQTYTNSSSDTTSDNYDDGEFDWDERIQALILSAFFYGYFVSQIPGGRMAEVFGSKWVFGLGVFVTGLLTMLIPVVAHWSPYALVAFRALAGLSEGVTYPSFYVMVSLWYPIQEQNSHFALAGSGSLLGTIITLPISAWLCQCPFLGGWPLVFYFFGILTCIWFVFWSVLVYSYPENHPRISTQELSYIQSGRNASYNSRQSLKVPVMKILTSRAVWALALVKFSTGWTFYVMLTDLPSYLNYVLHFSLNANGLLNSAVYLSQGICGILVGLVVDRLRTKPWVSLTFLRKVVQLIANCGLAVCLLLVEPAGCDWLSSYMILFSSSTLLGASAGGAEPMNMDIAPNHAGTVGGFTNGFSNLAGIVGPLLTGFITENNETLSAWGRVFSISACMSFGGIIVFLLYGSAQVQPWSSGDEDQQLLTEELHLEQDS